MEAPRGLGEGAQFALSGVADQVSHGDLSDFLDPFPVLDDKINLWPADSRLGVFPGKQSTSRVAREATPVFQKHNIFSHSSKILARPKSDHTSERRVNAVEFSWAFLPFFHAARESGERKQEVGLLEIGEKLCHGFRRKFQEL